MSGFDFLLPIPGIKAGTIVIAAALVLRHVFFGKVFNDADTEIAMCVVKKISSMIYSLNQSRLNTKPTHP
jgi:hypothetical protein